MNNSRGFTLIELLVVISILGLLFVTLVPTLFGVADRGKIADTEARILELRGSIAKYNNEMGDYPPSSYSRVEDGVRLKADSTNEGIECLLIHLEQKLRGATRGDDRSWFQNTDGDASGNQELVDGWGNPLAYFHRDSASVIQRIVMRSEEGESDGLEVTAKSMTDGRGKFLGKFQIISAGPDLEFNTDDDIHFPR